MSSLAKRSYRMQPCKRAQNSVLFLYKNPETKVPALPYRKILVIVFSKTLEAVRQTETLERVLLVFLII